MEDSDTTRGTGDLVNRSFSCPARSTRSVVSNLDQRLRLDHRKGGREWDYESEISGPQLTLREEPRPDTSGSKRAAMSRGERFTRPSVHLAINFAHKAFLARKLSARPVLLFFFFRTFSFQEEHPSLQFSLNPPLQLVSSTTLDTFLLFDTRTQSNPGPSRIHPSTSPRLNRGCWRLGTWIACLIRKKKKKKEARRKPYTPVLSRSFLASPWISAGFFLAGNFDGTYAFLRHTFTLILVLFLSCTLVWKTEKGCGEFVYIDSHIQLMRSSRISSEVHGS